MEPFRILKIDRVLDKPFCKIDQHLVELPNGDHADWWVQVGSDAVIVCPVLPGGQVLLQKTYKHGSQQIVTELMAGLIDDGETPEAAAHRELREETGYTTKEMIPIGTVMARPTSSPMRYHFFLALNATKTDDAELEPAEQIEPFTVKDIPTAIAHCLSDDHEVGTSTLGCLVAAQHHLHSLLQNS